VSGSVVKCDGCDARGHRKAGSAAPDFWFYLESTNCTPGRSEGEVYIVYACSEECRDGMWKRTGRNTIDEEGSKRMRAALLDRPCPRGMFCVHTPQCPGTANTE
jgi:hypothetical protein